jgi:hypothetical protein
VPIPAAADKPQPMIESIDLEIPEYSEEDMEDQECTSMGDRFINFTHVIIQPHQ